MGWLVNNCVCTSICLCTSLQKSDHDGNACAHGNCVFLLIIERMPGTTNAYVGQAVLCMISVLKQCIWHTGHATARAMGSHYSYIFHGCAPCAVLFRCFLLCHQACLEGFGRGTATRGALYTFGKFAHVNFRLMLVCLD